MPSPASRSELALAALPAEIDVRSLLKKEDATAEEFESSALHCGKMVPAGKKVGIAIGLRKPGRYEFIGDVDRRMARGAAIVT